MIKTLEDFIRVFEPVTNKFGLNPKQKRQVLENGFLWYRAGENEERKKIELKFEKLFLE